MTSIGSPSGQLRLAFDDEQSGGLTATLVGTDLHASQVVRDDGDRFSQLAAFFSDLVASWRGWDGDRTWSSAEGELDLTARHTGSHVVLRVDLRHISTGRGAGWVTSLDLVLDAGSQLNTASEAVSQLLA